MKTQEEIVDEIEQELIDIEDYADSLIICVNQIRGLLKEL